MNHVNEQLIEEVAKKAVRETLLTLGIATEDQESVISYQQDMAWLRRQRKATDEVAKWIKRGVISSVVGGSLWVLWEGLKIAIHK